MRSGARPGRTRRRVWRWCGVVLAVVVLGGLVVVLVTPQNVLLGVAPPRDGIAPRMLTDRGAATTIAALRELDACRLVDPVASSDGRGGEVVGERSSPHRCRGYARSADVTVTVSVGDVFGARGRWRSAPVEVGGVRAYRSRTIGFGDQCSVAVPVSFVYAVQFEVQRYDDGDDACPVAEQVAGAAVPVLRAGTGPAPSADAPLAAVDPCAVLAAAGRVDPARVMLGADPLALGPGIDRCTMPTGRDRGIELAIGYDSLGDTDGADGADGAECRREHVVAGAGRTVVVGVTGRDQDCPTVDAVVDRLPAVLATLSTASAGSAGRPVRLFQPGEPDLAVTGPCVDLPFPCLEPAPVTLPGDVDDLLRATDTSTSYTCEMAADPVRRVFGPGLRPTLFGDFCHFVDERHEIDVAVAAGATFDLRDYGNRGGYRAARDTVVAGHEARYRESFLLEDRVYDWTVRPRPGPPDPVADNGAGRGVLTVSVSTRPPRGEIVGPGETPSDPLMVQRSEALVADILTTYFT